MYKKKLEFNNVLDQTHLLDNLEGHVFKWHNFSSSQPNYIASSSNSRVHYWEPKMKVGPIWVRLQVLKLIKNKIH